jgi:MFS family permease
MHGPAELPAADEAGEKGERRATAASRRANNGQLAVVTFSHALQHIYVAGLAVTYPFVITSLHVSYGALGIVLGVEGVVGGLLQGVAGFASRISARLLLAVQNFGMAGASLMGGLSPGFPLFGAARCIGSIVSWPQHPVGSAVLTRLFPARRAYALSWHVAGGSIGTAVIPLVVSALIAADGWRVAVAFLAVPLAVGGVLVSWKLKDVRAPAAPGAGGTVATATGATATGATATGAGGTAATATGATAGASAAGSGSAPGHLDVLRGILRSREALGAMIAGTIAAGGRGLGTLAVFVPAYLKSGLHFRALSVGGLFTALVIGSIVGPVLAGHLADRIGRRRVLLVVYFVGAAAIATYVVIGRNVALLVAVGAIIGVFAYSESPLLQAVFADGLHDASHQGAFGYYFAVSYGIGSLWTIALGVIIDTAGFHWAFFVMAMSFVAAALVVWWARPAPARPASAHTTTLTT